MQVEVIEIGEGVDWFRGLTVHQKIIFKECFHLICGVDFALAGKILSYRERIAIAADNLHERACELGVLEKQVKEENAGR